MFLEFKNVSFSFNGTKNLLNNVSFELKPQTICALMGSNGSGKTTLFNLISGFLKPTAGKICFKGKDIVAISPYRINLFGIGRTFQDLRLITKLTVKENIMLSIKNNPTDKWYNSVIPISVFNNSLNKLNFVADKLINDYFLYDIKDSLASEISFGQQKLLTLACCDANEPDLLLLDEPIAGINPEYAKKIGNLLLKLKQRGKTIFFIEHNTEFISFVSDIVYFLDQGKIKQYSSINKLTSDKTVKESYF